MVFIRLIKRIHGTNSTEVKSGTNLLSKQGCQGSPSISLLKGTNSPTRNVLYKEAKAGILWDTDTWLVLKVD